MKNLLKINELAECLGVTPRTLRYYEEEGLLHPASVDGDTAYRYYSIESSIRLMLILQFRDSEMGMASISDYLEENLDYVSETSNLVERSISVRQAILFSEPPSEENVFHIRSFLAPSGYYIVEKIHTTEADFDKDVFEVIRKAVKDRGNKLGNGFSHFVKPLNNFDENSIEAEVFVHISSENPPQEAIFYHEKEMIVTFVRGDHSKIYDAYRAINEYARIFGVITPYRPAEIRLCGTKNQAVNLVILPIDKEDYIAETEPCDIVL